MGPLDYLTTTALSITVSGNTGVAPFTTLFIVGFIERMDPELLAMEGWTETVLSSWWSLAIFGLLTVLEFIGKCIPVVDELIDSVEVFIVPVFSILGSFATFGLFNLAREPDDPGDDTTRSRELADGDGFLTFAKVMLCIFGILLSLLVHLFKMLIRLLGEGCLTCCITTVEYTWITISLFVAIFIKPVAVVVAIILLGAAAYGFRKRHKVWRQNNDNGAPANEQQQTTTSVEQQMTPTNDKINQEVTQQPNGVVDVESNIPSGSPNGGEVSFSDYNSDDFDRPPAVAPHSPVVPTAPVEPTK